MIALAYTIGILAFIWRPATAADAESVLRTLLAAASVWTLAYVAAGFGVLGTDPFAQDDRRAAKPQWVYLYMLVAAGLGVALAGPSTWGVFVALTLTASLGWALWQKADEHLPLLLDPVARPLPQLSLPNGLIAIFLFFVLHGSLFWLFVAMGASPLLALSLGYVFGGLIVLVTMGIALRKVPRLGAELGVASGAPLVPLAIGALAGVAAGALGLGWLALLDVIPPLRELRDAAPSIQSLGSSGTVWVLGFLMVVGAPYIEEWLFRGFLYGGLRRTWGTTRSVLVSALLFAIVHPALAFPAVFGLGVATALVRERTGILWAAMVTHAVYNGIVLVFQFGGG